MEEKNSKPKNIVDQNFGALSSFTPLGSLTLIGSLIAVHVHDYLKSRETKEAEA